MSETVLIVGAGKGLSASLGRKFYDQGMSIHLAARNIEKLEAVAGEVNAGLYQCDASKIDDVANLFSDLDSTIGTPDLVIYNPSSRLPGGIADLDPHATLDSLKVTLLWSIFDCPTSSQQDAKTWRWQYFLYRRICRCEGISKFLSFCDGKIWT